MKDKSGRAPSGQAGRASHGASICVESPSSGDHPSRELPVITLWQPWASLIFTGDKKHETRSFKFPAEYAGKRVAIHAAKALPKRIPLGLHMLCEMNWGSGGRWRDQLPRGAVLGTVVLAEVKRTDDCAPNTIDRVCGDWSPGRFAWRLDDAEALPEPIAAIGKQGWWRFPAIVDGSPKGRDAQQLDGEAATARASSEASPDTEGTVPTPIGGGMMEDLRERLRDAREFIESELGSAFGELIGEAIVATYERYHLQAELARKDAALNDCIASLAAVRATAGSDDWPNAAPHFRAVCLDSIKLARAALSTPLHLMREDEK